MKNLTKTLGFLIFIAVIGCGSNNENTTSEMADQESVTTPAPEQKDEPKFERKLIKEGRVEFETKNIDSTRKTVLRAVAKHNGYISSDQDYKSPGRISNTIIIRVPSNNFDNLLTDATKGVNRFDNKEIEVKDVTEEFLDIQARLKTKKELETRYLELLKKVNNVTEILEIEKQIGLLRSEIESIEGRLKYLENKVSFSTLTLTFYEEVPNDIEFRGKFENGFRNGWANLIWFFVCLTNIWPFILLTIGLVVGIRIWKRKNKAISNKR